jgi:glucose-1-phosphate thymidylyltransferase
VGVIPAAGKGLRLGLPYPKELYPIISGGRYKPVAEHILENMVAAGVEHVVFVINETKHQLIGYFGDGARFGCRISYAYQDPDRKGQGGSAGLAEALDAAYHLYHGRQVVFGMADTIITPLDAFKPLMADPEVDVHLGLFHTDTPEMMAPVDHDGAGGVRAIHDKQAPSGLQDTWGLIVWGPRFSEYLHERVASDGAADFATILNGALAEGFAFRATKLEGSSYTDVGTYEAIELLERGQHQQPGGDPA